MYHASNHGRLFYGVSCLKMEVYVSIECNAYIFDGDSPVYGMIVYGYFWMVFYLILVEGYRYGFLNIYT